MYEELLEVALAAAEAGGRVLETWFRQEALEIRAKAAHDFVTRADGESETAVLEVIRRRFPDHQILSEEAGWLGGSGGDYRWIVDPLDGTHNFMHGFPLWGVAVACLEGDRPVAAVVLDPAGGNLFAARRGGGTLWNGRPARVAERSELAGAFLATGYPFKARGALDAYLAIFRQVFLEAAGIRRCGSAVLDLAYTAAGVFDGFFEFRLAPWDIAAGALLVEEAGGRITDLDGGDRYLETGNVLAGAPGVHEGLLRVAGEHAGEADLDRLDPPSAAS